MMLAQWVLLAATLVFLGVWAKISISRNELVAVPMPIIVLFLAAWGMKLDILKAVLAP